MLLEIPFHFRAVVQDRRRLSGMRVIPSREARKTRQETDLSQARGNPAHALWGRHRGGGWRPRPDSSWRMDRIIGRFIWRAAIVARPVGVSPRIETLSHRK